MTEVVIFSTSIDEPTFGPVVEKLNQRGIESWVFMADKVANGEHRFSMAVTDEGSLSVAYNNNSYQLSDIKSAWFRHPHLSLLKIDDQASKMSIEQEIESSLDSMWQQVPNKAWLNHPDKMRKAQAKLGQLLLAKTLGFETPDTVVSNNWPDVERHLPDETIIMKMPRGTLYTADGSKVLYCTPLGRNEREALKATSPYPGIFQSYKNKQREWRVTVVGEEVFPVAIHTSETAKDDWRKHQFTSNVEFKQEQLPGSIGSLCLQYLREVELTYGAFDLIEDYDGKITFLECNTNGQFKWLEDMFDLPISDAITDVLAQKIKR